jgi:hypothetical protein
MASEWHGRSFVAALPVTSKLFHRHAMLRESQ